MAISNGPTGPVCKPRRGRPAKDNSGESGSPRRGRGRPSIGHDPLAVTALQGSLLAQAATAGIPVSVEALEGAAAALAKFSTADLRALEVIRDSPLALEVMARLAVEDPDAFLKHFTNFLEFSKPKLARTEHVGNAAGGAIFITVETREQGPPPAARVVSEQ